MSFLDSNSLEPLKRAIKELHEVKGDWTKLISKLIGHFGVQAFLRVELVDRYGLVHPSGKQFIEVYI